MSIIHEILAFNENFVESKSYESFKTDRFPNKKLVILTCMDTRLTELLPRSMNIRNGDVKIIKNAGAIVSHPWGSVMRSILIAIYELGATDVAIIGHHECGMAGLSCSRILSKAKARGISDDVLVTIRQSGAVNLEQWLTGFENVTSAVIESVKLVRSHQLMPKNVAVHGLVIHPETGKLELVEDGTLQEPAKAPRAR
jgi:carbonic anhydrase